MASQAMNNAAERFASQGIGSIFIYSHEAHPGENYPPLRSMEQKFRNAHDLRDILGVSRPILVDSLDGACHRAYGSMPNMTWIFNRSGSVLYKSNWTDTGSVVRMIEHLLEVGERRKQREILQPFHVERVEYRVSDRQGFYDGLARNGKSAVDEFAKTFPESTKGIKLK
jgi:hypothetical protein